MKTKLIACICLVLGAALISGQYTTPTLAAQRVPTGRQGPSISSSAPAGYAGGQDGRLAFSINLNGNFDIYTVLPNGQDLRRLTTDPSFDACPSWSADGKQIAYCSGANSPGGVFEIWTMKANGNAQRQVTYLGGSATFPSFSPDGDQIVFDFTAPGSNDSEIYVINKDGSGLVQLTNTPGDNLYPSWSPDGLKIAFISSRSGVDQVWVMNAGGSQPVQLTFDPTPKDQLPAWSPDGRQIAYNSGADIFVMNADGSNQRQLTTTADPSYDIGPTWSADGSQIAFDRSIAGGDRSVYIMNADGSDQHAVHPLGRQLVPSWQHRVATETNLR